MLLHSLKPGYQKILIIQNSLTRDTLCMGVTEMLLAVTKEVCSLIQPSKTANNFPVADYTGIGKERKRMMSLRQRL